MNKQLSDYKELITSILNSTTSIKLHADKIYELRMSMDEYLTDFEKETLSSLIKSRVQKEAEESFYKNASWGAAYMGTGSGKSKIAIDIAADLFNRSTNMLLVVPTEKLRDEGWHEEAIKWGMENVYSSFKRSCYASLNKIEGETFDYVILDEGHNITENNSEFFRKNTIKRLILLTATKPKDPIKLQILKELNINCFFELTLDEAVKLGLVAPYDITVVTMNLDTIDKYIKAGSKAKPFMNTEKAQYGYLSARLTAMPNSMGFIQRMRFIYNLKSKTEAAKYILGNIIPKDLKTLIFCGSKDQANQVCEHRFYSKPTPPKRPLKETPAKMEKYTEDTIKYRKAMLEYKEDVSLNAFKADEINRLSCVAALNEGHNLANMDVGFIIQLDSNEKNLIQRIGRLLRMRPGYIGKIIILCVADSIDKTWVEKTLAIFNSNNITWIELSRLKVGIDKINF
jgi:superfamily II DNA or RNA helicase